MGKYENFKDYVNNVVILKSTKKDFPDIRGIIFDGNFYTVTLAGSINVGKNLCLIRDNYKDFKKEELELEVVKPSSLEKALLDSLKQGKAETFIPFSIR